MPALQSRVHRLQFILIEEKISVEICKWLINLKNMEQRLLYSYTLNIGNDHVFFFAFLYESTCIADDSSA